MAVPTAQQLKGEIESGPLAPDLAAPWADVFPSEPEPQAGTPEHDRWGRIRHRFGRPTPDGAHGVLAVLNDASRRSRAKPMAVATFATFLASRGLLRRIKAAAADESKPDQVRDVCDLVVTLTQAAPDRQIDPTTPAHAAMIDALVAASIATSQDKSAFLVACSAPCGRLEELGWTGVTAELLAAAKAL